MFTQSNLDEIEGRLDGIVQDDAEKGSLPRPPATSSPTRSSSSSR